MKLSCLPVSLFKEIIEGRMTLGEWAVLAEKVGLDAVDLSVLLIKNRTPVCIRDAQNEFKKHTMPVAMVTTYSDFTNPDEAQRKRELAYAISDIALASNLSAQYIRLTAGQEYEGVDEDQTLQTAAECFLKAKEFADDMGVKILFENHSKPGAWERPDYLFDTRRFLKFAELLKNTGIGINFDTANTFAYGDDPLPVLTKILPQLETIHVNDTDAPGSLHFVVAGTGMAPIKEIFTAVKRAGFDGWICIEEAGMKGPDGIIRAIDYVKKTWAIS